VTSTHAHAAIGCTIAKAREAKGLTKAAFGEKLGRHNSTVTFWETGKGLPSKELHPKIIKLLGLPKDALANGHATA
jgi:DNA-binding XRE family transcriptional regulator